MVNEKITPYGVFKDVMKCFIAACGITLLIIFFGNQSLFFKDGELLKQAVQAVTYCIFIILLFGTFIYRLLGRWMFKKVYGEEIFAYPMKVSEKKEAKLEENNKENGAKE